MFVSPTIEYAMDVDADVDVLVADDGDRDVKAAQPILVYVCACLRGMCFSRQQKPGAGAGAAAEAEAGTCRQ